MTSIAESTSFTDDFITPFLNDIKDSDLGRCAVLAAPGLLAGPVGALVGCFAGLNVKCGGEVDLFRTDGTLPPVNDDVGSDNEPDNQSTDVYLDDPIDSNPPATSLNVTMQTCMAPLTRIFEDPELVCPRPHATDSTETDETGCDPEFVNSLQSFRDAMQDSIAEHADVSIWDALDGDVNIDMSAIVTHYESHLVGSDTVGPSQFEMGKMILTFGDNRVTLAEYAANTHVLGDFPQNFPLHSISCTFFHNESNASAQVYAGATNISFRNPEPPGNSDVPTPAVTSLELRYTHFPPYQTIKLSHSRIENDDGGIENVYPDSVFEISAIDFAAQQVTDAGLNRTKELQGDMDSDLSNSILYWNE